MARRKTIVRTCIVSSLALWRFGYASATPVNTAQQPIGAQQTISEDDAVRRLRAAAQRGDTTAEALLSYRLWEGRGVGKNLPQSVKWLRDAAEGGNAMAQVSL